MIENLVLIYEGLWSQCLLLSTEEEKEEVHRDRKILSKQIIGSKPCTCTPSPLIEYDKIRREIPSKGGISGRKDYSSTLPAKLSLLPAEYRNRKYDMVVSVTAQYILAWTTFGKSARFQVPKNGTSSAQI